MNKKIVFLIFVSVLAGLNLGTVRRTEDPIRDTQTNPILYEQKKEEEKDGKKGPLLYNVKYIPREKFFIDPPYEADKKSVAKGPVTEEAPTDIAGWWEEQPTGPQTASTIEAVAEPLQEPLPEEGEIRGRETAEPTVTETGAENAPADDKANDYWW